MRRCGQIGIRARCGPVTAARRQRGVALLVVLWALVLLTAIAVSYGRSVRAELRIARNQLDQAQSALLAEAGLQRALFELRRAPPGEARWSGRPVVEGQGRERLTWAVRNAGGLVDLNSASPAVLDRLLQPLMEDSRARSAVVDAILDWRDPDELTRVHGAERRDYIAAGRDAGPRNGPFAHPAELLQVLGMTPERFRAIRPFLGIHGGQARIDPRFAPAALLRWLNAGTAEEIDAWVVQRERSPGATPPPGVQAAPAVFGRATSALYRLEGTGRAGGQARSARVAVWRFHGGGGRGEVIGWDAAVAMNGEQVDAH